jgi:hypothetical protein
LKKNRIESLADVPSNDPLAWRLVGQREWQNVLREAIYRPRPVAAWRMRAMKKPASK